MPNYLAVDLGAESGRVILGELSGGKLTLQELHRFPNGPVEVDGTLRWDLERLWKEIRAGLQKARGLTVESVSVDSWALDYVLTRKGKTVVERPFCYRDARTIAAYEEVRTKLGEAAIYEETGIQFMRINTLYQLMAEDRGSGRLREADGFLMIGDWFHFLLSGKAAQEESNASTTQLWNPRTRRWSESLIEALGLPRKVFPDVVPPCTELGEIDGELAAETGLGGAKVIAGCVHDTGAAVAAVPARGDDWAYISSGTWSLVGVELPGPLISEASRKANFTNETGVGGTSRFLKNAGGMWLLQECRRRWKVMGQEFSYEDLSRLAEEAEPFRSLVNPDDASFLRPENMIQAIADFCRKTDQPIPETPGQCARCILESLALLYGSVLALVAEVTGRCIRNVHIIGGGSRNVFLNQMTADATGCSVIAGPTEATAIGNLLLQALALGDVRSHAEVREVVRRSFEVSEFKPQPQAAWANAKKRFAAITKEDGRFIRLTGGPQA